MGVGLITDEARAALTQFLTRRQAKEEIVDLLDRIKAENKLKRGAVTTSQSAPYVKLVASLDEALQNDWLKPPRLDAVLNDVEIAGRQHVYVFRVAPSDVNKLADLLRSPKHLRKKTAEIAEYWTPPDASFARLVVDDGKVVILKIVMTRKYATEQLDSSGADFEMWKKSFHRERSAIILKLDVGEGLLQVRIPPKEHGSAETVKGIFALSESVFKRHFGDAVIQPLLKDIKVAETFEKLLENRKDFILEHDRPESDTVHQTITTKSGADETPPDLRDAKEWDHGKGYTRPALRGFWSRSGKSIYLHINQDKLSIGNKKFRYATRLFFPTRYSDGDIDHAIGRILSHF